MPFTPKAWQDSPATATPINAAALVDLETRTAGYAIPPSQKDVASGVAGLDAAGLLKIAELPSSAVNFNVKAYGAKGDGTTDDTTAIQAAINAASAGGGGTVVFGAGAFITGLLTLPSNVTLQGFGRTATLKRKTGVAGSLVSCAQAVAGVRVRGLVLDNNSNSADVIFYHAGAAVDVIVDDNTLFVYGGAPGVYVVGVGILNQRIRVRNNDFVGNGTGSNIDSVIVDDPYDVWVAGNLFDGGGAVKMETTLATARFMHVTDNVFRNQQATGVLIRPNYSGGMEDIIVTGNSGVNLGSNAVSKGLVDVGEHVLAGTAFCNRIVIANNTVKQYYGHAILVGGGSPGCTISGVTVDGNTADGSDLSNTLIPGNVGITVIGATEVHITGNSVQRVGLGGIRASACSTFSVTGNNVAYAGQDNLQSEHGIVMLSGTHDGTISGNTVRNTASAAASGLGGIGSDANGGNTGIVVSGNRSYDDRGTKYQQYGVCIGRNDVDANQPLNWTISFNDLRGNLTQGIKYFEPTSNIDHLHSMWGNMGDINEAGPWISRVSRVVGGQGAWTPGVIANGAFASTVLTGTAGVAPMMGAGVGDTVTVGFTPALPAGMILFGAVTAAQVVTVTLLNQSGSSQTIGAGTITVDIFKH